MRTGLTSTDSERCTYDLNLRSVPCRWGLISWVCTAQNNERQSLVLPLTLLE